MELIIGYSLYAYIVIGMGIFLLLRQEARDMQRSRDRTTQTQIDSAEAALEWQREQFEATRQMRMGKNDS